MIYCFADHSFAPDGDLLAAFSALEDAFPGE